MVLSRKNLLVFALFAAPIMLASQPDLGLVVQDQEESFQIRKVCCPGPQVIRKEFENLGRRQTKRYMIAGAGAAAAVTILLVSYQIRQSIIEQERLEAKEQAAFNVIIDQKAQELLQQHGLDVARAVPVHSHQQDNVGASSYVTAVAKSLKSFGKGSAKFAADSAMMLTAGVVMSSVYNYLQNKISQAYQTETVHWYIQEHTKINEILADLKTYGVDYDLQSSLLSAEVLNQDAQLHMKAFVKDLLTTSQDYVHNEIFKDPAYFGFLLGELKKKYVRQSGEFEKLQEYVVPAVAKRDRALVQDQAAVLFVRDMARRGDIAQLCNMLSLEVEKLSAFILACGPKQQARVSDFILSCNAYLAHIELMLNSSPEKIVTMSKANRGMFTSSYEYEKLFNEQVGFLHRYCKLVY